MENKNDLSKKLIVGLIVGGIVGAGVLYLNRSGKTSKTPVIKKIGKTISQVGEMIENYNPDNTASNLIQTIEDKVPKGVDIISTLTDWVDTTMNFWKKIKKG